MWCILLFQSPSHSLPRKVKFNRHISLATVFNSLPKWFFIRVCLFIMRRKLVTQCWITLGRCVAPFAFYRDVTAIGFVNLVTRLMPVAISCGNPVKIKCIFHIIFLHYLIHVQCSSHIDCIETRRRDSSRPNLLLLFSFGFLHGTRIHCVTHKCGSFCVIKAIAVFENKMKINRSQLLFDLAE